MTSYLNTPKVQHDVANAVNSLITRVTALETALSLNTVATYQGFGMGSVEGALLSVNANPALFDLAAGSGVIVDNITDPENPTLTRVSWEAQAGIAVTNITIARELKTELSITTLVFVGNRFIKNKRMVVEPILTDSQLSYTSKRQN